MGQERPKVGDRLIDLTALTYLQDLQKGELRGLLPEKEGLSEAVSELEGNQAEWGGRARITEQDISDIQEQTAKIEEVDAYIPVLEKALEMLEETRAALVDKRERKMHALARLIDTNAGEHKDLIAKYEKTRKYRSATGVKAAQSRRRKAAEEKTGGDS